MGSTAAREEVGMSDGFEDRFGGLLRLYGRAGVDRLRAAHVLVVGIGGVGSWSAEALARSGIGRITLVDLDDVCVTNMNRQLHALEDTVGKPKVEVMADRIRRIHPGCEVVVRPEFFTEASADGLLVPRHDFVVDAIDHLANKCLLIARCRDAAVPLVVCGGAGGRSDPTRIRVADLAATSHDRLLAQVRLKLRREHGFPGEGTAFGVPAVFSVELPRISDEDGRECVPPPGAKLGCEFGYGSAAFVTGSFGLGAAAVVVRSIAGAR